MEKFENSEKTNDFSIINEDKLLVFIKNAVVKILEEKENSEEILGINEAAKLLRLKVSTLYSKVCRNEIPHNKSGNRLYFSRQELINHIKKSK